MTEFASKSTFAGCRALPMLPLDRICHRHILNVILPRPESCFEQARVLFATVLFEQNMLQSEAVPSFLLRNNE